jgi:hypothetical protein
MGVGYNKAVTKFNPGDYAGANNHEDDLAIVSSKLPYRTDDIGSTTATASTLSVGVDGTFTATGIIETATDADVFRVTTTGGLRC